jgi:phospholipid/cholesterol/gamma-HCH transport system substrate-binding protein
VLVKQRAALDEVLAVAPTALTNLFHTYNPSSGTLDTRSNIPAETLGALEQDPALVLCGMLHHVDKTGTTSHANRQPHPPPAPNRPHRHQPQVEVEHIDRSLGGIVEVSR